MYNVLIFFSANVDYSTELLPAWASSPMWGKQTMQIKMCKNTSSLKVE